MKKYLTAIIGICFLFLTVISFSQTTYTHDDFTIDFPEYPTKQEQDVQTEVGVIKLVSLMNDNLGGTYMLAYGDYPAEKIKASSPKDMLQGAKGGFVGNLGVTISEENSISLDGYEGIYFKGSGNGLYFVMKDYLVENRLYQIGILRSDRYPNDHEIRTFIDSFKLSSDKPDSKELEPLQEK